MERLTNRPQMKEQENFPEEPDKLEASNLSDREFRITIIRPFKNTQKNT